MLGGRNSYESIKRYEDKAYDKVLVRMPKGRKDIIKAHAEAQGESTNGFINRAIDCQMERDTSQKPSESPVRAANLLEGINPGHVQSRSEGGRSHRRGYARIHGPFC